MSNHLGNANKMVSDTPRMDSVARINEYLGVGGLFNPEILNVQQHEAVRDTLIQARDELNAANDRIKRLEEAGEKMAELIDGGVFMKYAVQWYEAKEDKP